MLRFIWISLLIFPRMSFGLNSCNTGWQINNGSNRSINCHGTCNKVTNTIGKSQFVSTKTSAEWSSFRSNLPSGLVLSSCVPTIISVSTGILFAGCSRSQTNDDDVNSITLSGVTATVQFQIYCTGSCSCPATPDSNVQAGVYLFNSSGTFIKELDYSERSGAQTFSRSINLQTEMAGEAAGNYYIAAKIGDCSTQHGARNTACPAGYGHGSALQVEIT